MDAVAGHYNTLSYGWGSHVSIFFLVSLCYCLVVSGATLYCMVTLLYLVFLPTRKSFHLSSQIHQRTGFISAATY